MSYLYHRTMITALPRGRICSHSGCTWSARSGGITAIQQFPWSWRSWRCHDVRGSGSNNCSKYGRAVVRAKSATDTPVPDPSDAGSHARQPTAGRAMQAGHSSPEHGHTAEQQHQRANSHSPPGTEMDNIKQNRVAHSSGGAAKHQPPTTNGAISGRHQANRRRPDPAAAAAQQPGQQYQHFRAARTKASGHKVG